MTDASSLNSCENSILIGTQSDVVSVQQPILETEVVPPNEQTTNKLILIGDSNTCGAVVDVDVLVNQFKEQSASTSVENDCNLLNNAKPRGKRRRRKSNRTRLYGAGDEPSASNLVPYNTNKFLMEEHMPILGRVSPSGRTRNSSFSVDSEDYFNALPEDEEAFLTKEFSSVYETVQSERLDGMSKNQLIREYLQLEANYDKLSKTLGARVSLDVDAKAKDFESRNVISHLEERVKQLTDENLELRRLMADIRNRGQRSHSHGSHYTVSSSSEDSESDSTTSSSNVSRSRSRSNSSSDGDIMDGVNCSGSNCTQKPME
ncbi:Protein HEXIM1 [Pseudolycoriella hygida]|uniref:Protein HEXIM1 n=1 Tax=Pseudolycoriella hygida TaxID=35572 RepID=A0A9Q0MWJ3_9DIPT|nr:Protein HEXIM1 [Pseudolycoriella hygida]